jgi:hypothetical protein
MLALGACGGGSGGASSLGGSGSSEGSLQASSITIDPVTGLASVTSSGSTTTSNSTVENSSLNGTDGVAAPGVALAGDVVDADLNVVPSAYRTIASQMSTDAGIAYRYGPYTANTTAAPTWWKREDIKFTPAQQPNANPLPDGIRGYWQVGGPVTVEPGDYFSNMANAAFVADSPSQYSGVSVLGTSSMGRNTFAQLPQLSWVFGESHEDRHMADYKKAGLDANGIVGLGRCAGRPGWCLESIAAFQNGLLAMAIGSNTAMNKATTQLASGLVPTAVAVTNSSEFALVTVWDTVNLRGRVAVVALAGLCNGCSVSQPDMGSSYWGEWRAVHPGFANLGNVGFMKVLGYVDLPGMKAPTDISVTTGWDPRAGRTVDVATGKQYVNAYDLPLSEEANRRSFLSGTNSKAYAKAGVAVVVSKSEQKVAFIDLKPLFAYYQNMYLASAANYNRTTNLGYGAGQWPFVFSEETSQIPTVIKTIGISQRPTAVKAYLWGDTRRAWIATQDGTLHIYDLGDYPTAGSGSAESIRETGTVAVGKNPTALVYSRSTGKSAELNTNLLVVSRGDRKVDWIAFAANGNSGSIFRTLRDSRLIDPISADDNESHGTESYVLSIADYNGRAVSNYRYGPVIFQTNVRPGWTCQPPSGCPVTDSAGRPADFEFGGSFVTMGKAFQVTSANVP